MRISDWSSDVCSSDLQEVSGLHPGGPVRWEPPDSSARGASGLNIRPEADSARPSVARRARGVERDRRGAGDLADAGAGVHVQRDPALEHQVAFHHRIGSDHDARLAVRSEEHTSELQSLMRISYAVFCLKKKNQQHAKKNHPT